MVKLQLCSVKERLSSVPSDLCQSSGHAVPSGKISRTVGAEMLLNFCICLVTLALYFLILPLKNIICSKGKYKVSNFQQIHVNDCHIYGTPATHLCASG